MTVSTGDFFMKALGLFKTHLQYSDNGHLYKPFSTEFVMFYTLIFPFN